MGHQTTIISTLLLVVAGQWYETVGVNPDKFGKDDIQVRVHRSLYEYPFVAWPRGIVPYYIEPKFNAQQRAIILDAMNEYHKYTCIRFKPYEGEPDYLYIKTDRGKGCNTDYIGWRRGVHVINLELATCFNKKAAQHELMHAIGFDHEQNRPDRDRYVRILWENVQPGMQHNFNLSRTMNTFGLPYDYYSLMHYWYTAFSYNGQPTILPLDPNISRLWLGQSLGFSRTDVAKINRMYNCRQRRFRF